MVNIALLLSGVLAADIQACQLIEDDGARLACYDGLANEKSVATSGKWVVETDENPLDDSKTVTLALESDEGRSRFRGPVLMVLRCKSNKTEVYLRWGEYLGREAMVTGRVGKNKPITIPWNLSTDSQATFFPGQPIGFIKKLMEHDKYVAQVTPYNESPTTAVFDISGLSQAVKPLRQTCGW